MKKLLLLMAGTALIAGVASAEPAKQFKKWDTDKDGKMSQEEYTAMTKAQYEKKGKEGYEADSKKRFENKDADKDGSLTLEEFSVQPGKDKAKKSE